ncbi:hypothetical protein [Rheinheimera aquimaris]|uniref:hypothetical protein n=2 Tax=Rheinheimera aquimaris TaxID=412437 RepID=UPI00106640CE|nr:hypothetical protein [Rheinheimera aquimaris]|tara:strand:- start:649 stop:5067 length:4419 start_codon:yes stop_codon:yes gene_type:complete
MDSHRKRYTGVLVVTLSLIVAAALTALFYYYKIEKNETYQNQLHFRELQRYGTLLTLSVDSFSIGIESTRRDYEELEQDKPALKSQLNKKLVGKKERELAELEDKIKKKYAEIEQQRAGKQVIDGALEIEFRQLRYQWIDSRLSIAEIKDGKSEGVVEANKQKSSYKTLIDFCIQKALYSSAKIDDGLEQCVSGYFKLVSSLQKIKFPNMHLASPEKYCNEACDSRIDIDPQNAKASLFVFEQNSKKSENSYGMVVPLEDFFTASSLVPLVMLTDNTGKRLFRAENLALGARHQGLRFENLTEVVKGATTSVASSNQPVQTQQVQFNTGMVNQSGAAGKVGTDSKSLNLLHSRYFDTELAGEPYRIFVTPWSHPQINKGEVFYLFGVQARNVLMLNKLSVSTSTVLVLLLLVLILVAFLPLLKIRLVGYSQTFSRADTHTLMLGFVILLTALSLALFHFLHYSGVKHQLDTIAREANKTMRGSFAAELKSWEHVSTLLTATGSGLNGFMGDLLFPDEFTIKYEGQDRAKQTEPEEPFEALQYWPEGVAKLYLKPDDGKPYFTENAFWSSYKQVSISRANNPLTGRSYVNDAFSCKQIEGMAYKSCDENIYIEQVLNRRDLRLNTWIGKPIFKDASAKAEDKLITIVGGQLLTFTQPVMPRYFQFLVFDNHSGEVLMHSDSRYSKIDNIYVDTDNNNLIKALVRQGNTQPEIFNAVYKGKDYRFAVSRLKENVPWTLVVMYDKAPFRMLNMLAAFFAFVLCVLLICIVYLLIRVLPKGTQFAAALIWPRKLRTFEADPSISTYIVCRFAVVLLVMLVLAILLGYYSANYLTTQYNVLNKQYVTSRFAGQYAAMENLKHTIYDGIEGSRISIKVPCFGFKTEQDNWSAECVNVNKAPPARLAQVIEQEQAQTEEGFNFINYIWQKLDLDMPLLNEFWAIATVTREAAAVSEEGKAIQITETTQGSETDNTGEPEANSSNTGNKLVVDTLSEPFTLIKTYLTFWTSVVLAIVCSGVLVLLYLLLRYWVCRRLMGLDQPPNFRISPHPPIDKAKNEGYRIYHALARILTGYKTMKKECFYVQLIRPAAAMQALINGKIDKADESLLRTAGLAGLTLHRVQEFEAAKTTGECCSDKPILALSGFETLPLEKEKRLKALAFLQQLKQQGDINLILVVEVAPLYRLTHPEAYPVPLKDEDKPTEAEVLAWSELLRDFVKIYDWVPSAREFEPKNKAVDTLLYEASAWPELERVAIEFLVYHFAVKDRELYLETQGYSIGANEDKKEVSTFCSLKQQRNFEYCAALFEALKEGRAPEEVVKSINQKWKNVSQVIDFFGTAAGAHYRYRWELCTTQERLLMINIANEHLPNPRNYIPLDHLVRRGFIFRDKGWHLVNHSFQKFVRTAEDRELVRAWVGEASESIWKYTRFPLLVLLFLLLAGLAYTATEAFQSFFGIFSAVLGAIPLVLRIFSFTRGGSLE